MFNYQKICQNLLKDLPQRTKDIILRRFGLQTQERETLEAIGKSYEICRERVRQIEEDGLARVKPRAEKQQKIFQYFRDYLKAQGDLRKEDSLLSDLGGKTFGPHIFFLLTLGENFERFPETEDFYPLWTIEPKSLTLAQKLIDSFYNNLVQIQQPLSLKDYSSSPRLTPQILLSYLEISKKIEQGPEGLFGLKDWPEINPRGIKDKAYLALKKARRPLHFGEVAELINSKFQNFGSFRPALPQTVHNELIKDDRFVLVGRGLYALKEWGYQSGSVKDIIFKILKEARRALPKEKVIKEVLKQRLVKENTILLNLNNKRYFLKDSQGRYTLAEM